MVRKRKDAAAASSSAPKPVTWLGKGVVEWQMLGKRNPIRHEAEAADAAKPLIRRQEARRKAKAKAGTENTGGEWWSLFFFSPPL